MPILTWDRAWQSRCCFRIGSKESFLTPPMSLQFLVRVQQGVGTVARSRSMSRALGACIRRGVVNTTLKEILVMPVIASNDDYIVHFHEGVGESLLVTFAHMDYDRTSFWAQSIAENLALPTVGVICRQNSWYPDSLNEVAPIFHQVAARYQRRIGYGFSMGGYGAIKHSKNLALDSTIAMSPQYSIDPSDGDLRFAHFFTQQSGGALKKQEIAGRIHLIFDPTFSPDACAAEKIKDIYDDTFFIKMWYVGHATAQVLAGQAQFQSIWEGVLSNNMQSLQATTNKYRRAAAWRVVGLWDELRLRNKNHHQFIAQHWPALNAWWQHWLIRTYPDYTFPASCE